MATYPWRFQADLKADNINPDVTVFVGDQFTNDTTGEKTVQQSTADPIIVPLAELSTFITTSMASGVVRDPKPEVDAKKK